MRIIYILAIAFLWLSCRKSEVIDQAEFNQQIRWTMGAEHAGDTVIQVEAASVATSQMEILSYSLCPDHQLRFSIFDQGGVQLFEITPDTLVTETFDIPTGQSLTLQAELIPVNSQVQCVWLGQVEIVFRYIM